MSLLQGREAVRASISARRVRSVPEECDRQSRYCGARPALTRLLFAAAFALVSYAANGTAQIQSFSLPSGGTSMDVDVHGNLFILDAHQGTLSWFNQNVQGRVVVGGPGWENGRFDQPAGVWAKNGLDVYVADFGNHRIQRFDRTLSFVSALSTRDAEEQWTRFGYPTDITLSRLGSLFICDSENGRIVKVDAANRVETAFGGFGGGAGRLQHPVQVECGPSDWIYVLDPPRVVVFDSFGNFLTTLGEGVLANPTLLAADEKGVAVLDGADFVCFTALHRPLLRVAVANLAGENVEHVQSVSLAGDRLYLLLPGRVVVLPDPRIGLPGHELEKEGESQ